MKLSVVLATYNEELNIRECLNSVKEIADEVIVVDGSSTDNTRQVAEMLGAKVIKTTNPPIFHINKQKALEAAKFSWILQLDADERLSNSLSHEIKKIISMDQENRESHQQKLEKKELFLRHQQLIEQRDGKVGSDSGDYAAFFVPRANFFLGKFLRYGGVYPDGVIRLVKKGKAYFPCKSVHEQIVVNGKVGWLASDLIHIDSPTFKRYLERNSRYINLIRDELKRDQIGKNPLDLINYFFIKPSVWFLKTYFRHKGFLDGFPGFIFSLFSSLRFPRAYWRYLTNE